MNETVWIIVIVSVAVVLIVFTLRHRLSEFRIKINSSDIDASIQNQRKQSNISGNLQLGGDNVMSATTHDTDVTDNRQMGKKNKIQIRSSPGS